MVYSVIAMLLGTFVDKKIVKNLLNLLTIGWVAVIIGDISVVNNGAKC